MVLLPIMDNLLYNIQRQGKISFYVGLNLFVTLLQSPAHERFY